MVFFLGIKLLLMVTPALLGVAAAVAGLLSLQKALIFGALLGVFGMIGPSFWLDRRKRDRQGAFRRALPDALDTLVICLEGGLSLPGALRRVVGELRTAHPMLAAELNIVQREVQMGRSPGEALGQFANRCDLEEVRSLASVITQSERFGASLVKSLRVHAEMLRVKRLQHAEEMAQKAATKLLIPTILFIFPCIFIIVMAPAVIQVMDIFAGMRH
jgi:tight adherence protein C